jgi:hypothetical protein
MSDPYKLEIEGVATFRVYLEHGSFVQPNARFLLDTPRKLECELEELNKLEADRVHMRFWAIDNPSITINSVEYHRLGGMVRPGYDRETGGTKPYAYAEATRAGGFSSDGLTDAASKKLNGMVAAAFLAHYEEHAADMLKQRKEEIIKRAFDDLKEVATKASDAAEKIRQAHMDVINPIEILRRVPESEVNRG